MTAHRWIPLAFVALAACQEEGPDLTTCGANELQELVGQSPEMMGMVDIPEDARMWGPDTAGTTDYVPQRLNIYYDENSVITRVSCG